MNKEILKISKLSYRYSDAKDNEFVLKDINYSFKAGKFYAIKGKSGSGKTTLLSLISGLESNYQGSIKFLNKELKDRRVLKLSGGEQQRVAIARSLSYNPKMILADEPTGNLDKDTENEILKIFKDLAHKDNKCIIIVTHSENVCNQADIVY